MSNLSSEVILVDGGSSGSVPMATFGDLMHPNRTHIFALCAQFPDLIFNMSTELAVNCSHFTQAFGEDMIAGWVRFIVLILYGIVCIVGLCGNTLVIYVVIRFSKMHTVTNLYIVNLAIADECFLVGLPFLMTTTAVEYWPFGQFMCKMYLTTTGVNQVTSSMFLLIMSADRFIAVCHPISATKWRTPMISSLVTMTAWGLSAVIMVPIFIFGSTQELGNTTTCNIYWPKWMDDKTFMMYSFLFTFALPFVLISIFYILVICRLRNVGPKRSMPQPLRSSYVASTAGTENGGAGGHNATPENCTTTTTHHPPQPTKCGSGRSKDRKRSHRKVTKLVLTVISVYFLSWAPYWGLQLALATMESEITHSPALVTIFLLSACLSYSNSAMNPILYAFLSDNFKKSFMKACSCANQRDVNAILHGETSAGLPRMKSAERLRRRKKSKSQHKMCLLHKKNHSQGCGGGEHPDGICVVNTNGLKTLQHGNHSPITPTEGLLLRPAVEVTEVLNSPCIDENDTRLFAGESDESSDEEGPGDDGNVGALIDMEDEPCTKASGPRFGTQLTELFNLSPINANGNGNGDVGVFGEGSGGILHANSNSNSSNANANSFAQTFVKDGVHMTEL